MGDGRHCCSTSHYFIGSELRSEGQGKRDGSAQFRALHSYLACQRVYSKANFETETGLQTETSFQAEAQTKTKTEAQVHLSYRQER